MAGVAGSPAIACQLQEKQSPQWPAKDCPEAWIVQAESAKQPDKASQQSIEETRMDKGCSRAMAQGGCICQKDGHWGDEDGCEAVMAHYGSLDDEGQRHHQEGNAPLVQRETQQPPGQ